MWQGQTEIDKEKVVRPAENGKKHCPSQYWGLSKAKTFLQLHF